MGMNTSDPGDTGKHPMRTRSRTLPVPLLTAAGSYGLRPNGASYRTVSGLTVTGGRKGTTTPGST
ncbi:hypothetical protein GCM10010121_002000 [Streptomyces brasiliensis]|uniref:Uncharacterized protein n=1 Tax=Streptomyces brasiliensis TaxID=1954 RepID=A0A917K0S1_9ACTN|nr:hypothetical protein GCM10010121_002000 [Streptomyces brasiliensis]